jgi:hypothetical protein
VSAAPLYATPRDPSSPTDGAVVDVVATELGTPLLDWQRHVVDVAGERLENGAYRYPVVVVSVPRQCGKTTLLRAVGTKRALIDGRDVFYTAQTGKDARARWHDLVEVLELSPTFRDRVKVALRGGSEHVRFTTTGAVFQCFAPTPKSLHGYTPPTVMLDEAFGLTAGAGELLYGAVGPAQITLIDRQLWIVSTAGTAESVWFHAWVDKARAGEAGVAGFIYGAGDDVDVLDPDLVASWHPTIGELINGKRLTGEDIVAEASRHSRAEYERAFCNRRTLTDAHTFPRELLRDRVRMVEAPADLGAVVLSYDVAFDRSASCIVATWDAGGVPHSKVVMSAPGTAWLVDAVVELDKSWRPATVAVDDSGPSPTSEVTAQLAGRVPLDRLNGRRFADACGDYAGRLETGRATLDGSELLELALLGIALRPTTDGAAFSRRHSAGNSAPAVAAAVGTWVLTSRAGDEAGDLLHTLDPDALQVVADLRKDLAG